MVVTDCISGYGGIAEYNRNFLHAIDKDKYYVHVFPRLGNNEVFFGENWRQHKPIRSRILFSINLFLNTLLIRPKIIFNGHIYMASLTYILSSINKSKLVNQFHGTEIWENVLNNRTKKILSSSRVSNLSVSEFTRNKLFEVNGIESKVVYNTWNEQVIYYTSEFINLKQKLGIMNGDKVILTVGRLDERRNGYKGHRSVIDFIQSEKKIGNYNWKYIIVGKGPDYFKLSKIVRENNLQDSVFLVGYVEESDLKQYYSLSDFFVLLSDGEGFGIVYLEALGCGTPCVGLKAGGVLEVLEKNHVASRLIGSDDDLKGALHELSDLDLSRTEIIENVKLKFGRNNFTSEVRNFISSV